MSQPPLSLLCIEPRFPGHLGAVADWLVRKRGYRCQFWCTAAAPPEHWPPSTGRGLEVVRFAVGGVAREPSVSWSRCLERSLCYSYGCWETLEARRPRQSFDVVLGRSAGLGSTLFAPVWQRGLPLVQLFDYYYHPRTGDLAEEQAPDTPPTYFRWRQASNAIDLLDLENATVLWTARLRSLRPAGRLPPGRRPERHLCGGR
jgi:hypothetical protein